MKIFLKIFASATARNKQQAAAEEFEADLKCILSEADRQHVPMLIFGIKPGQRETMIHALKFGCSIQESLKIVNKCQQITYGTPFSYEDILNNNHLFINIIKYIQNENH